MSSASGKWGKSWDGRTKTSTLHLKNKMLRPFEPLWCYFEGSEFRKGAILHFKRNYQKENNAKRYTKSVCFWLYSSFDKEPKTPTTYTLKKTHFQLNLRLQVTVFVFLPPYSMYICLLIWISYSPLPKGWEWGKVDRKRKSPPILPMCQRSNKPKWRVYVHKNCAPVPVRPQTVILKGVTGEVWHRWSSWVSAKPRRKEGSPGLRVEAASTAFRWVDLSGPSEVWPSQPAFT